jgi:hypothetical protein
MRGLPNSDLLNLPLKLAKSIELNFYQGGFVTNQASNMVRAMVLRELEEGRRDDGLWLQAMSESKMDKAKAQVRYMQLRTEALQGDVKGLLIQQIRGAVAQDNRGIRSNSNADLAAYLSKPLGGK